MVRLLQKCFLSPWSIIATAYLFAAGAQCLSWGGNKRAERTKNSIESSQQRVHFSSIGQTESRLPNKFSVALSELQELESEPLCHRIAARLLINNCQVLDGKDEASIMTDSGIATRDFVDSYAASLAICDLERGSFVIPSACSKFQESTLATLPPPSQPQLHVTTLEIDGCLEGLAQSDSAWNTWVSYRHKALRFCEAARVDNEKDENIRLHQKLTKILSKLTSEVEEEIDGRIRSLHHAFSDARSTVDSLNPRLVQLKNGLTDVEDLVINQLFTGSQQLAQYIQNGLGDARELQQLLDYLFGTMEAQKDELRATHESSLELATTVVTKEFEAVMETLATAVTASSTLQREIERSALRAAEVSLRQDQIEMGMKNLEAIGDNLLNQQQDHKDRLNHAYQSASQLLSVLDSASDSAMALRSSISTGFGWKSWWPYVLCPVTSLLVGSYGLPPSILRNFMLVSLGELAGLALSIAGQYNNNLSNILEHEIKTTNNITEPSLNLSEVIDSTIYSNDYDHQSSGNEHPM